jgi:hypothetical protein
MSGLSRAREVVQLRAIDAITGAVEADNECEVVSRCEIVRRRE